VIADAFAAGRYLIEDRLGGGGMAAVYRARDLELERDVALKVLAVATGDEDEFRKRFLREARVAARLSHPHVVQVYDAGEDGGRPYIVMEYVPGETAAQLLARRHKLSPSEASALALQAALGLQHAHENGLVHRDVKPQNLLVRDDGVLKVADFGIARAAEASRLTKAGMVLGTAAYLAPEQATGGETTAATDLYSLGAVLYELLTGRTPYQFRSLGELAAQQSRGAITPVRELEPAVPPALEALVMRCLAAEPRFRPDSAADVAAELATQTTETTVVASPSPTPRTGRSRRPRRRRARLWVGGAVLVSAIALVVGLVDFGGGGGAKTPPPRLQPHVNRVPPGTTPAEDARNLARWLREYSG